ncbi:glycosyl transferase family 2 [Chryseobacterium sp. Leaf180]|uniref:glycosyltransferase n=1 Tax=Chryseobacterium sp. Leaf180 TaxID=1736289 RepID=UPI0006F39000|nr:glycosyltransferase [Chryseobacterium sp. Leaf180]KQR94979.1 glycosyl transferase family 2 [Chryseobacterium sp. Leaf180]
MSSFPAKISAIVPVYNVEKYLAKCLNSLLNQTWQNLEIIIVDDGSTDRSADIIDEYVIRFPDKIKALQQKNGGLSDARNAGIDAATGDFIGFVDSDDFISETMFEEMIALAEKHDAEMVICNIQKVDEAGNVVQKLPQIPNMPEKIILKNHFSVFSDLSYFACNKLFRKELFDKKRFRKGMHFEDIELIPQLLLECKTVAQTQNYHYQYFTRPDSISKTHSEKGLDMLHAIENVESAFSKSVYSERKKELRDFQILEGVYSFLAYLAFVKDEKIFKKMDAELKNFVFERNINIKDILLYRRFGKNYLLSLPLKKKIYYLLYFAEQKKLIRKIL